MPKITILHTSDLHNEFPPLEVISPYLNGVDLILDSGDALRGSNTLFYFNEPILVIMREAGYSAMSLGNREFHYIRGVMANRQKESGFPMLAANLVDFKDKGLFLPFIIKEIKTVRIGIIGLTVPLYPEKSFWERLFKFRFLAPSIALKRFLPALYSKVDLLILLSHLGIYTDKRLALQFPEIDIILGGHSHIALYPPLKVGKVAIIHSGARGRFVSKIVFNIDKEITLEDVKLIHIN